MELSFNQPSLKDQPENEFLDGFSEKEFIDNLAKEVLADVLALKRGKDIYKFSKVWQIKSAQVLKMLLEKPQFRSVDRRSEKMREIQDEVAEIVFAQLPDNYKIGREQSIQAETREKSPRLFSKKDIARLSRQAQLKQWREERRAGQGEDESDLI